MTNERDGKGPFGVGELIELDKIRIKRNAEKDCKCAEPKYVVDVRNNRVECTRCGAFVHPMQALIALGEAAEEVNRIYKARYEQSVEMDKYRPALQFVSKFEEMYMKKQALPKCPHCNEPFILHQIKNWGPFKWAKKRAEELVAAKDNKE